MSAAESLNPDASLWDYMSVHLRKERQRRNLSQSDVAQIIGADKARVANYEAGRLRLTDHHADALDQAWGTMYAVLRRFAVKVGIEENWAKKLGDFEQKSLSVKIYSTGLIPVPFQTESYAREMLNHVRVVRDVEASLRKRMARTELLLSQLDRMSLWVLIDERALDPPISDELKREQLEALLALCERASVRVIPDGEWHAGQAGTFEMITTPSGEQVAYMWAQLGGKLVHEASEVQNLALRYDRMGAVALTEEATRQLIRKKLESLQ
ncbi:helix-turn-helix domain-containing protein [Actinomadura harenae]|uniref:XRE family transcriptional regulator n=1 Tax=Actinomadura harenae TaxID=2483351 RepID=A0A3M2LW05_9ACTN|nr:helix-turn-helix transcriptional regulator [Actinomadura harenae]RMI40195.1 XRE family transcriptional regulator [Actinomadura harenae]